MKTRILIADDKEENLYLLESLLKGNGYEVISTSNGEEALEAAIKNPPNLIITDILMPVMDGFTLCRKWKAHENLKKIPLVFYTATYTDVRDEEFALHLGADRFIVKPQEPDVLMMIIKDVLTKLEAGEFTHPSEPQVTEVIQLREYNQALIRKLEDKVTQTEEAKEKFRCILSCAGDAIISTKIDGTITSWNETASAIFEYKNEEVLGKHISIISTEEYIAEQGTLIDKLKESQEVKNFETVRKSKSGKLIPVEVGLGNLINAAGKRIGIVRIIRDITERKQAEQKMESQLKELQQWYNVTVGREGRVVELKKEVNELLKQLGKPEIYLQ